MISKCPHLQSHPGQPSSNSVQHTCNRAWDRGLTKTLYTMVKVAESHQKVSPIQKLNCAKYHVSIANSFLWGAKKHFGLLRAFTRPFLGPRGLFSNSKKILRQTMFLSSLKRINEELWLLRCSQVTRVTWQEIEEIANRGDLTFKLLVWVGGSLTVTVA